MSSALHVSAVWMSTPHQTTSRVMLNMSGWMLPFVLLAGEDGILFPSGVKGVKQLSAGWYCTCAVMMDSTAICWGMWDAGLCSA